MSYQVLARKWRPRNFSEMVGQEHVLRALINALDNNRLHHAYLFTGTRGVGKTTIARILAKCLNCEQGVSSSPCGTCSACVSIAEGRFIDLIEVDAASRTKVEDTRELLENVQYAPTVGRYKVYLIDEVHMLSGHSFNALLKTLEEPPPHVKFLLATTDPQKLPVTILSRCLQFNLKNLSPERIVEHLKYVLAEEQVPNEEAGLWALARAADGSMRDALSLTDQAISHGGGQLTEAEVNSMLGTIDLSAIADIARALANRDGTEALAVVGRMAEHAPDYSAALGDLLSVWHRVAIAQTVPDALDNRHGDYQLVQELAKALSPEDVQLFYQIALLGRRDLPLTPEPRLGFEMALLRTLAFRPVAEPGVQPPKVPSEAPAPVIETSVVPEEGAPLKKPEPVPAVTVEVHREQAVSEPSRQEIVEESGLDEEIGSEPDFPQPPIELYDDQQEDRRTFSDDGLVGEMLSTETLLSFSRETRAFRTAAPLAPVAQALEQEAAVPHEQPTQKEPVVALDRKTVIALDRVVPEDWFGIYQHLNIGGLLQNIAANLSLVNVSGGQLRFVLDIDHSTLYEEAHQKRLAEVLESYFDQLVSVVIEVGAVTSETPAATLERKRRQRQEDAVNSLKQDPHVRRITDMFNGILLENTIKPLD
ncbi:MAG: DNA polymerase III subunit gamma/tau [Porticoccaceae bacterium]